MNRIVCWRMFAVLSGVLATVTDGQSQVRFTVEPKSSLGWWQINPHLSHLWATTCPEEPSWRPGEGRSGGWSFSGGLPDPKHGFAAVSDTTIVPLYPRYEALPICTEAVSGEVMVSDTARWRGIRGRVVIKADKLVSGDDRRDEYARKAILQTERNPDITFTIDSVVNVREMSDTIAGLAFGTLALHGVTWHTSGPVRAWPETEGLRVTARARFPAQALIDVFDISKFALGLGVTTRIWKDIFMGVDIVLRPSTAPGR